MSVSVPPDTSTWEEAVTHGFYGERTDPYPDTLYVPGVQADLSPTLSAVTPATGPETGGTAVVVTGTLLFTSEVIFGGMGAAVTAAAEDGTSLDCVTPAGVAGPGAVLVSVVTPGGYGELADGFTYEAVAPPE